MRFLLKIRGSDCQKHFQPHMESAIISVIWEWVKTPNRPSPEEFADLATALILPILVSRV